MTNKSKSFWIPALGHFLRINDESLVTLALAVRKTISGSGDSSSSSSFKTARVICPKTGSLENLVYIVEFDDGVKYVIRVPGAGWGNRFTDTVKRAFISQVTTMDFVRKNTSIPLPEVYAFDTASTNEIGAPYMVVSFLPGRPVSQRYVV